ncbi:hypothetical protein PM082_020947 [Marasmius tenuissimus]|nr:hypothetical protein PM082_020947 [Marasmius tenuissimus]
MSPGISPSDLSLKSICVSVLRRTTLSVPLQDLYDGTFSDIFEYIKSHPTTQDTLEGYQPDDLYYALLHSPIPASQLSQLPSQFSWLIDNADLYMSYEQLCPVKFDYCSMISVVIDEPPTIADMLACSLSEDAPEHLYRTKEVITYLREKQLVNRVMFDSQGYVAVCTLAASGPKAFLKMILEHERSIYEALEPHNPSEHHIATALYPIHQLGESDLFILVTQDYGAPYFYPGTDEGIIHMCLELCEAVLFLHSHHIAHLDIKAANVAVDRTQKALILLDLGNAMRISKPLVRGASGTHGLVAPEV